MNANTISSVHVCSQITFHLPMCSWSLMPSMRFCRSWSCPWNFGRSYRSNFPRGCPRYVHASLVIHDRAHENVLATLARILPPTRSQRAFRIRVAVKFSLPTRVLWFVSTNTFLHGTFVAHAIPHLLCFTQILLNHGLIFCVYFCVCTVMFMLNEHARFGFAFVANIAVVNGCVKNTIPRVQYFQLFEKWDPNKKFGHVFGLGRVGVFPTSSKMVETQRRLHHFFPLRVSI